jgi:hypothetical protein
VPRHTATSFTLALHAALWLPITALGAYYAWRESISWREMESLRLSEGGPSSAMPTVREDVAP